MSIRLLPMLLLVCGLGAAEYYVDATGGNNGNAGTIAAPWQTLAHVTNQVLVSGDTVYLKRGETWAEQFVFKADNLTLDAYGTGALPIIDGGETIRTVIRNLSYTGTVTRNVNVKNGGGGTGGLWESAVGSNTIEDCVLENHASDAIVDAGGNAHMIVRRCIISGAFDDGVTLHSTASALVEDCTIKDCSQGVNNSGTAMDLVMNDCVFTNNVIDIGPLSACVSEFNRCRFDGRVDALANEAKFFDSAIDDTTFTFCVFDSTLSDSSNWPVFGCNGVGPVNLVNCTFVGADTGRMSISAGAIINATNCIFYSWSSVAITASGTEFNAEHCLFYDIGTKNVTSNQNELTSDPLFTNAGARNYTLQAGSPALNAGLWLGAATDLAGVTVLSPPNLGAFEDYTGPYRRSTIGGATIMRGSF